MEMEISGCEKHRQVAKFDIEEIRNTRGYTSHKLALIMTTPMLHLGGSIYYFLTCTDVSKHGIKKKRASGKERLWST